MGSDQIKPCIDKELHRMSRHFSTFEVPFFPHKVPFMKSVYEGLCRLRMPISILKRYRQA